MINKSEIRIRDPFILTDAENNCYYMYGTTALIDGSLNTRASFSVYKSYDLESFEEPRVIFDGEGPEFWAEYDFWAPEVHKYNGKYYLFGSFKSNSRHRGTQILVCDTPDGKFTPLTEFPVTPSDWECLDGTLWVENGTPYLVFSHEWTQIRNGEICALPLSDDLTQPIGDPIVLFRASDSPVVTPLLRHSPDAYVTDGPFLYREDGKLKMMWSSFTEGRYQVLIAQSDSLLGTWKHFDGQYEFDGGHAMLFETLEGKRMISLHSPNTPDFERAVFYSY